MGDSFQTVAEGTIMPDISICALPVGNLQKSIGMSGTLAAIVQFKLHTEVPGPFFVEDGFRLVVIVMDTSILNQGMETGGAMGTFIIFIRVIIIGLAFPEQTTAPAADLTSKRLFSHIGELLFGSLPAAPSEWRASLG